MTYTSLGYMKASEPEWSNQENSYKKYARKISYPDNVPRNVRYNPMQHRYDVMRKSGAVPRIVRYMFCSIDTHRTVR